MPATQPSAPRVRSAHSATRPFVIVVSAIALATATLAGCVAQDGPLGPGSVAAGPHFDEVAASSDSTATDSTATDSTATDSTATDSTATGGGDTTSDDDGLLGSGGGLLVCPSPRTESVAAEIGPDGGALVIGATRVDIPAHAVQDPATFVLTIPAGPYLEIEVHAEGVEHYQFQRPVSMTIDYGRCPQGSQRQLNAWYIDADTKELLEQMGGVTDPAALTHTFETSHLSAYALSS